MLLKPKNIKDSSIPEAYPWLDKAVKQYEYFTVIDNKLVYKHLNKICSIDMGFQ